MTTPIALLLFGFLCLIIATMQVALHRDRSAVWFLFATALAILVALVPWGTLSVGNFLLPAP